MLWYKRKWTGVSTGLDFLCQLLYWFAWSQGPVYRLKTRSGELANDLLDRYCRCERCLQRGGKRL
jgi:hypothetical protein